MENIIWVVLLCAVLALLFAAWKTSAVSKADAGTERMKEIAGNISDGARAFLFAEYKILVIFVAVLFVLIGLFITWLTAGCFLIGAVLSSSDLAEASSWAKAAGMPPVRPADCTSLASLSWLCMLAQPVKAALKVNTHSRRGRKCARVFIFFLVERCTGCQKALQPPPHATSQS
jgi:hypothetical protein